MAQDTTVNLALIGILGTVVATLFKLLMANTKALAKVASSSDKVAKATVRSANEAKERNGHLGDLVHQGNQLTGKVLTRLEKTAKIAQDTAEDGGLLVRTKPSNPVVVQTKEANPLDVKNVK